MRKRLVAYFSASGVTAGLARNLAKAAKADLFEIEPVPRYTSADLDWHDSQSRSSLEMKDPASRPPVRAKVDDMAQYDTVFVGFPIWWYVANHPDLSGKLRFFRQNRRSLRNVRRERYGQNAGRAETLLLG